MRFPSLPQSRSAAARHRPTGFVVAAALALGTTCASLVPASGTTAGTRKQPTEKTRPIVWTDLDGRGYTPVFLRSNPATVFLFFSTECPLANAYVPRIRQLEETYYRQGVRFFLVDAHPSDTVQRLRDYTRRHGLVVPVVRDAGAALVSRLGASKTPEAVVVGRAGEILYRGRIDDHKDPKLVRRRELSEALDAVLAGRPVATPRTEVTGCFIPRPRVAKAPANPRVTFSRDIAPIMHRRCAGCHRPGDVAPFSLVTYEDARTWAETIKDVTQRRIMPPWKPVAGYGEFHDARAMTPRELELIRSWVDGGTPPGELKAAPRPPASTGSWTLGPPDVVIRPEKEYRFTRSADEGDEYRCFVLPAEFKEDTYVTATQIRPGNRSIVHHIIVYIDPTGKAAELDAKDPGPGFENPLAGLGAPVAGATWLAGWAPGNTPRLSPPGVAVKVPKGARLVMEVHYHPNGQVETDRSTIGLTLARDTVHQIPVQGIVARPNLEIPAGDPRVEVKSSVMLLDGQLRAELDADLTLHSISPHMHNIGREMRVWATLPDGSRTELLWVKDWDFNWQETYHYRRPVRLPKGTKLEMTATYDNSSGNPRNPNRPPKKVTWGEATTDEMCVVFLNLTLDDQRLDIRPAGVKQAAELNQGAD